MANRPQFGISALMWGMLVFGMVLAYLRRVDGPGLFLLAGIALSIASAAGLIVGAATRRWADCLYWSLMITTGAFLSVASESQRSTAFVLAWCMLGAFTGSACGAVPVDWPLRRMLVGAAIASLPMLAAYAWLPEGFERLFDLLLAPVIGILIAVLIELVLWLERKRRLPRYITASWLLAAVVIGNWLVPLVRG